MQLAILHHHLNRGGVSQVIVNHLRSLASLPETHRPEKVVLVFDGQRDSWPDDPLGGSDAFPVEMAVVPEVGYNAADEPDELAASVAHALTQHGLSADSCVLHTHNHSLGKNLALPGALGRLAQRGWRLLLQIHDFAEDNRPANYRRLAQAGVLGQTLYPQATQTHYAFLTLRDAQMLRAVGIHEARVHTLPNPVGEFTGLPDKAPARQRVLPALELAADTTLFVYPVRAIRRKNLGEMLLLSALAPEGTAFALTLAPMNPVELPSFDRWVALAEELRLPCWFDTGGQHGLEFFDTLAASNAVLTTSVAEGFGMVFLESWLVGRPLVGRDLPDVTTEFRQNGLKLDSLYAELAIPLDLLDADRLRTLLVESYCWACQEYDVPAQGEEQIERQIAQAGSSGGFDFGQLPPSLQAEVIRLVATSPNAQAAIHQANPKLANVLSLSTVAGSELIESNADAIRQAYSLERLGGMLNDTYQAVLDSPVNGPIEASFDSQALRRHFVTPERLYPVRTEP